MTVVAGLRSTHMPTHGQSDPHVSSTKYSPHIPSSRLTIEIVSAALRLQCKVFIGAELSLHVGVRRSVGKRFHDSRSWS
jgi:hypothetical protein